MVTERKYNLIQNVLFVYSGVAKHKPYLLFLLFISMISTVGNRFVSLYFSKNLIDYITMEVNTESLAIIILELIVIKALCMIGESIVVYGKDPGAYYVRPMFMLERNIKHINLMYENLEYNEVLDAMQKSKYSTSNIDKGIEGVIRLTIVFVSEIVVCIWAVMLLFKISALMVPGVIGLGVLSYVIIDKTAKKDKILLQDNVAYENRKKDYFKTVSKDFSYGKDIRLYNVSDKLLDIQYDLNSFIHKSTCQVRNLWKRSNTLVRVLTALREGMMYALVVWKVFTNSLTVGEFVFYIGCVESFALSFQEVLSTLAKMRRCSREVNDYRIYNEFCDSDLASGDVVKKTSKYDITFKDVSYKYPNSTSYALNNVNITLTSGEKLAVVGMNGAGKTTFIKLLQRLYDPTEGAILLNGKDIRLFDRQEYYSLFSTVFQDMECYAFSLAENISMQPEEETDKKRAEECAVQAGLGDKLAGFTTGIDTPVLKILHDDGFIPSGGEKQKLALARALYKDAPVVILDEPTAALDALAENTLYERFNSFVDGKSAVYISHRLASTRFCDRIALFENGQIVEYGTHEELIRLNGKYAAMFSLQASYYKEEYTA